MNGEAGMHYRDDKPMAATAIVVAVVLGIGGLVRIINSTYEPNIGHRPSTTSAPLWVMAGK
jgi:hypothetical protein